MRYHVVNLLQTVVRSEDVAVKMGFRLGRCQRVCDSGFRNPRPTLVEVDNLRHREWFLAPADRTKTITTGVSTILPDDVASGRIKVNNAKGCKPGFSTTRLQNPKLRIQKLIEEGQLNAAPHSGAGGKLSEHTLVH